MCSRLPWRCILILRPHGGKWETRHQSQALISSHSITTRAGISRLGILWPHIMPLRRSRFRLYHTVYIGQISTGPHPPRLLFSEFSHAFRMPLSLKCPAPISLALPGPSTTRQPWTEMAPCPRPQWPVNPSINRAQQPVSCCTRTLRASSNIFRMTPMYEDSCIADRLRTDDE